MKKAIQKGFRIFFKAIGLVFLSIVFYLTCAWILSSVPVEGETGNPEITLYLKSNGVHTDIIVPATNKQIDWTAYFPHQNNRNSDTTYKFLALGLGDREFYLETPTWGDLTVPTAFNAAFGLGSGVMHAAYYKSVNIEEKCIAIQASQTQYQKLIQYVIGSVRSDKTGKFIPIKTEALYGNADAFYEATWKYSMLHTCNTWVNNALKESRLKACMWTPFDWGLFGVYEKE